MQTRIHTGPVTRLALGGDRKTFIKERKRTPVSLFLVSLLERVRKFEKRIKSSAPAHDQIAEM